MFVGFVPIGDALSFPVLTVDSSQGPIQSSVTPTYRVYGNAGLLSGGTGSLNLKETGSVTGASNANPIVITSASHGLTTGMKVTITGVLGNTNANGTFTIIVLTADTFSLTGATGNAGYISGGTWNTTGYYTVSLTPTEGGGYAQGQWYDVLCIATISGVAWEQTYRFGVI